MINSALMWNVRGLGNKATVRSLARLIKAHKTCIAVISEPRVDFSQSYKVARSINLQSVFGNNGNHSKIWLFNNSDICLDVIEQHF